MAIMMLNPLKASRPQVKMQTRGCQREMLENEMKGKLQLQALGAT